MASTINAKNTSTGVVITPDASGQLELQTADTTRLTINSSGNVGIGTSSPTVKLESRGTIISTDGTQEVRLNVDGNIELTRTDAVPFIDFKSSLAEDYDCRIQQISNGLAFSTGGNGAAPERMRIDSSGNVLIGTTTSPAGATPTLIGGLFNPNTNFGISLRPSVNIGAVMIAFYNSSGTSVGSIQSTASATSYNTSSDYRLKDNVTPMTNALASVEKLNPVTWNWKIDGSDGQGFIAHELQAVIPDAVTGEKDAVDAEGNPIYQGVDTSFLVATLTKAIQELKAELDTVKAELATLKGTA